MLLKINVSTKTAFLLEFWLRLDWKVGDRFWACLAAAALLQSASGSHSGGSDAGIPPRSIPAKETLPTRGDGIEATPCGKGVMVVAVAVMLRPPLGGLTSTRILVFTTADPVTEMFD